MYSEAVRSVCMEKDPIEVKTLSSMDHISQYIGNYGSEYIFRGMADKKWELKPKIARNHKDDWEKIEAYLKTQFYRKAKEYLDTEQKDEELVIAQHFGLPTRLLDWSEKFTIALYFACKELLDKDGVVYVLNSNTMLEKDEIEEIDTYLYYPRYVTDRVKFQSGCFTFHTNPNICFIDYVKTHNKFAEENQVKKIEFEKIIIKSTLKKEIIIYLDKLGINEYTLFSGLDGLCRYLGWKCCNRGDVR